MRAKKSLIALDLMGKSSIILNKRIPLRAFDEKLVKFSLSGKNRTYQNLWDAAKAVHRETFEAFNVTILERKKTFKSISKS